MSTTFPRFRTEPTGQRSPKTGQLSLRGWWWLWTRLFGGSGRASAIVHDYAYQVLVPSGRCTRAQADDLFARALKAEGVAGWLRGLMVDAVRYNTARRARA